MEKKVTRFSILVHKRLDKGFTIPFWTQWYWAAIIVDFISVDPRTCSDTRDVVNCARPTRETGRYEDRPSVSHQVHVIRNFFTLHYICTDFSTVLIFIERNNRWRTILLQLLAVTISMEKF